jgi:hypothetical protein
MLKSNTVEEKAHGMYTREGVWRLEIANDVGESYTEFTIVGKHELP